MKPLVIIPARVGSKGVENKNFRPLPDGTTLLSRAVAVGQKLGAEVIVTTDAPSRCRDLESFWASRLTVLTRPAELAQDDTPMAPVVEHVLWECGGADWETIVLLQPTTPLRRVEDVEQCLAAFARYETPVASVRTIPQKYWRASRPHSYEEMEVPVRRQEARPLHLFSGEAYVFPREWGLTDRFRPVVLSSEPYINIDDESDWSALCRLLTPAAK